MGCNCRKGSTPPAGLGASLPAARKSSAATGNVPPAGLLDPSRNLPTKVQRAGTMRSQTF